MNTISTPIPSPEVGSSSQRAEYWWRRLVRVGFNDEQLDQLRDEISRHGLSLAEFYTILESRGAPAAQTFLEELANHFPADPEAADRARGQLRLTDID
jgi:hypothetical protein